MDGNRRTRRAVRETPPPYGRRADDPRFPADDVLLDLATVGPGPDAARHTALILARYAALRCWLLRTGGAPSALTSHAVAAARAHLDAAERCPETGLLLELVEAGLSRAGGLLALAAEEAGRAGHAVGAAALAEAARRATLLRLREARRRRR